MPNFDGIAVFPCSFLKTSGAARTIRTAPPFINESRHFTPTDDLSSK